MHLEEDLGLALDIDDTLSATNFYWMRQMQERFGNPENLTVPQIMVRYRFTYDVPWWQTADITEWCEAQRTSNEVQECLPPIENACIAVRKINSMIPIRLYLTTRPTIVVDSTRRWLTKHGFPLAPVIARPPTISHREGNVWKARMLCELYPRIGAIIDDNPFLVNHLPATYNGVVFLYGNAQSPREDIAVVPCPDWQDVQVAVTQWHTEVNRRDPRSAKGVFSGWV